MNKFGDLPLRCAVRACIAVTLLLFEVDVHSEVLPPSKYPEWIAFRSKFPDHIQGVALSKARPDGSRILVIAEPPPHVTLANLKPVSPEDFDDPIVLQHRIGHDGWTKDIVIKLPPRDDAYVSEVCVQLNRLLFGTTYKAYVMDIPDAPVAPENRTELGKYRLDLQVTADELQRWLITNQEPFYPVEGGSSATVPDLLRTGAPGVFFSKIRGVVLWLVPQGGHLQNFPVEMREFTLDSDLILGAIAGRRSIAILGRERSVPVTVLPPLRLETLVQLSSVGTYQLAQSYERNNGFAGRCTKTTDWAPIYLSPQLVDTEYGSLLNITDQLLKSWSNRGLTRYEGFLYPTPKSWPFSKPLPNELGVDEVTYNWNTKGAGYAVDTGTYVFLALDCTGALPISYIPGGGSGQIDTMKAEDSAYHYFRGIGDPNLARVVQYAGLYQIFTNFDLNALIEDQPPISMSFPLLDEEGFKLLERIRTANATELKGMAAQLLKAQLGDVKLREVGDRKFTTKELNRVTNMFSTEVQASLDNLQSFLIEQYRHGGEAQMRAIASIVVGGGFNHHADFAAVKRSLESAYREGGQQQLQNEFVSVMKRAWQEDDLALAAILPRLGNLNDIQSAIREQTLSFVLPSLTNIQSLQQRLVETSLPKSETWIHTPSVVVSENSGELASMEGGHNLSAIVSPFRVSEDIAAGELKLAKENGASIILCNPADADKVEHLVREVGRNEGDLDAVLPRLENRLKSAPSPVVRDQRIALDFDLNESDSAMRGLRPANGPLKTGWEARVPGAGDRSRMLAYEPGWLGPVVDCHRSPEDLFYITYKRTAADEPQVFIASTRADVVDVVGQIYRLHPPGSAALEFYARGFEKNEASALLRSLEIDAAANRRTMLHVNANEELDTVRLTGKLRARYDFAGAKIEEVRITHTLDGSEVSLRMNVAPMDLANPPLTLQIRFWLEDIVGEELVAQIEVLIRQVLESLSGHTYLADLNVELQKAVNAFLSDHKLKGKVRIDLDVEKHDVQISQTTLHSPPDEHDRQSHAT
jgi:hypothetical protein